MSKCRGNHNRETRKKLNKVFEIMSNKRKNNNKIKKKT